MRKMRNPIENANDEVMEWNESTGEVPAEIWEMVEENDGCLDGCDETASVSQPSGDREPVTCHKLTQTELRREEVGVQTENANTFEYIDTADFPPLGPCKRETLDAHSISQFQGSEIFSEADQNGYLPQDPAAGQTGEELAEPIFHDCVEEWEMNFEMLMLETDNDDETFNSNEYNTDDNLKINMNDPRDYPHGDLYVPEKGVYNKLQDAQTMEEPSADCTWLLFHRGASDIARRFYRLSDPIGVDDIFKENILDSEMIDALLSTHPSSIGSSFFEMDGQIVFSVIVRASIVRRDSFGQ